MAINRQGDSQGPKPYLICKLNSKPPENVKRICKRKNRIRFCGRWGFLLCFIGGNFFDPESYASEAHSSSYFFLGEVGDLEAPIPEP
ncbi:hypothetical protein CCACVL1_02974 [Corchorus capsularis]|uniref:Uncharacterized protein n=1 Tax=Corchorus capsularis TaxID=210143 RepID=A0A1R3K4E8_COCAP|nr:hypothetical protein CCACVL1_02974 [Corchorus capsularis]